MQCEKQEYGSARVLDQKEFLKTLGETGKHFEDFHDLNQEIKMENIKAFARHLTSLTRDSNFETINTDNLTEKERKQAQKAVQSRAKKKAEKIVFKNTKVERTAQVVDKFLDKFSPDEKYILVVLAYENAKRIKDSYKADMLGDYMLANKDMFEAYVEGKTKIAKRDQRRFAEQDANGETEYDRLTDSLEILARRMEKKESADSVAEMAGAYIGDFIDDRKRNIEAIKEKLGGGIRRISNAINDRNSLPPGTIDNSRLARASEEVNAEKEAYRAASQRNFDLAQRYEKGNSQEKEQIIQETQLSDFEARLRVNVDTNIAVKKTLESQAQVQSQGIEVKGPTMDGK